MSDRDIGVLMVKILRKEINILVVKCAALEAQLAEVKKCDIHEFIHYQPNLDGRKFYEVDDITTIIDKSSK